MKPRRIEIRGSEERLIAGSRAAGGGRLISNHDPISPGRALPGRCSRIPA